MFALIERGESCELDYELGFRSKNGDWKAIADILPQAIIDKQSLRNLSFANFNLLDSSLLYEEGCDQFVKVDWRVYSTETNDRNWYVSYSGEHDVFATIVFKETLCEIPSESGGAMVMIIIPAIILVIIIVVATIICRVKRKACFSSKD